MPEIDVVHVWRSNENPLTHEASTPDGSIIAHESPNWTVDDLVEIGAECGVTRWAEHTAADGIDQPSDLVLVGWAESPIQRADVERSYHRDYSGKPMVNVKVQSFEVPDGEAFVELLAEFDGELDPRLAALSPEDLHTLVSGFVEKHFDDQFSYACERGYESAEDDARYNCFPGYPNVKVWSAGRSGGWLVVDGLPEVESWGVDLLTAWNMFATMCRAAADDIPRSMAWQVLANRQDELAGRVVRVELTFTLSDADLDSIGNDPMAWDWHGKLDLDLDCSLSVRDLG